ncbi:putative galactinol--sucrose galactosyltransferase 1 [Raphanus sativus]|nr:putative galactinol--sucrose galactosyltransferase 1 [Raphanus sativus]
MLPISPTDYTHIKENYKFQKDGREGHRVEDPALSLRHVITDIKSNNSLKYVYVWHALTGYWGGVKPGVVGYGTLRIKGFKVFSFYNDLHSYLASVGIDGVKVDVQKHSGNSWSWAWRSGQTCKRSITMLWKPPFQETSLTMRKKTAVIRASDDFWPRDPASHTIHIASVAYNTLFLGEFMQPDGTCSIVCIQWLNIMQQLERSVDVLFMSAAFEWTGDSVVYSHLRGELVYLPKGTSLPITLKSREYEVFTVVPVKEYSDGSKFAPVGLIEMFNSGGAIVSLRYEDDGTNCLVQDETKREWFGWDILVSWTTTECYGGF